jgi:hypothetical protein
MTSKIRITPPPILCSIADTMIASEVFIPPAKKAEEKYKDDRQQRIDDGC